MFQVFDLRLMLYQQILNLRNVLLGIVKSNIESSERGRESFLVPSGTSGAAPSRDALLLDPHARGQRLSASSFSGLGFNSANELGAFIFSIFAKFWVNAVVFTSSSEFIFVRAQLVIVASL